MTCSYTKLHTRCQVNKISSVLIRPVCSQHYRNFYKVLLSITGAEGGIRTRTVFPPPAPQAGASASSATSARVAENLCHSSYHKVFGCPNIELIGSACIQARYSSCLRIGFSVLTDRWGRFLLCWVYFFSICLSCRASFESS